MSEVPDVLPPPEDMPPASADHGNDALDLARASARRTQAVRLRLSGATYEQIADTLGYSDKGAAHKAVVGALARVETESVQELRIMENARLDMDERVLRGIIADTTQPASVRIKALDSRRHLSARRARLNGLDAPMQVAISSGAEARLNDVLNDASALLMGFVGDDGAVTITGLDGDTPDTDLAEG